MASTPLTRVGTARTRGVALFVVALCAALAFAATASAVTRRQASKKALAALGSKKGSHPVIVFGLRKPLRAATKLTYSPWKSGRATVTRLRRRSFFYYEDSAPFQAYPHRGRVALVGAKHGKVRLSKVLARRPLVGGRLPAFLRTSKSYGSAKYQIFARYSPLVAPAMFGGDDPFGSSNSPPKADRQSATVKRNAARQIRLTGSDDDGDLLTFQITKPPDHGSLSGQPPDVTYTPDPGYLGADSFSFKTNDGGSDSNTAKVSLNVVPVGQPPAVTTSSGCTAYTEHGTAVVVDGGVSVADPDDTELASAKVRVANFQDGDDLLFTDQNGISSSYDDTTGELTLTGTASVASYQTALRSVRYSNLATRSSAPTKDIEFTANDAGTDSAGATRQICVTGGGANDPPNAETSEGALSYTENDGPLPLDAGLVVGDPDSGNLSGATVKFISYVSQPPEDDNGNPIGDPVTVDSFAPAEDELGFVDLDNGISGSYDDETGVLTLTGTATIAKYEATLRAVTYENSSENPSTVARRLRFQVTDSSGALSAGSTRDIFVTAVNDAPAVTTSDGSTSYTGDDPPVAVDPALTAIDVDDTQLEGAQVRIASGFEPGDELAYAGALTSDYDGDTGILTLSGTASVADYQAALRSVEYSHPGGNPAGSRTVEFVTNDGDLDSDAATKALQLNDRPVADTTDAALSYTENAGPVAVDPDLAVTDADSATLSGATVQISSNFSAAEDELAFISLENGISGFYDDDTGTLTLTGTASVTDYRTTLRSVSYENSSDDASSATRTITFQIDDGAADNNLSDPATRDVEVAPVNDAPGVTASDGSTSYTAGDPAVAVDAGLTVSDLDDESLEGAQVRVASGFEAGDELAYEDAGSITGDYDPDTGVLTLTGTASVADYETALRSVEYGHTGADPAEASKTVEFTVNDGDSDSDAATKSIDVTLPPPPPPPD